MPLILTLTLLAAGCSSAKTPEPFTVEEIESQQLMEKMDAGESFVLMAERDGCEFCQAMNEYLEQTASEHPGVHVYRINTSDLNLYKESDEDKTLISSTDEGTAFLERFPYFLYTPAIYQVQDGKAVFAGIGYDENRRTVSSWDVDSTIDWQQARPVDVWEFLEQTTAVTSEKPDSSGQ